MVTRWNPEPVMEELEQFLAPRFEAAGRFVATYIQGRIGAIQGSVVPFVASKPGQYPFDWDGTLRASVQYEKGEHPLQAVIGSDAIDMHMRVGDHFSGGEEFGHWWDGWAWDFQTGKLVKVAPAHEVEPRPFLRRGLQECREAVFGIIAGNGGAV